jgi:glycosyltransferase involved in cell wall biosynthesis
MKLSLIIAYTYSEDENRLEGLKALMESIESQTYKNFETIVVEDTQGRGMTCFPFKDKVNRIIAITDPEFRKFNKSWVMNVGAREANTDNLVFIDAEISFGSGFLKEIIEMANYNEFFNCWSEYICKAGRDNPKDRIHYFPVTISAMIGAFYSTKDFFFNILGGYNENYFGYGGEDNDIYYRANYLLEEIPKMEYTLIHNYHHWHPKNGANPLSTDREKILKITLDNPNEVIHKLIKANIGDRKCPHII